MKARPSERFGVLFDQAFCEIDTILKHVAERDFIGDRAVIEEYIDRPSVRLEDRVVDKDVVHGHGHLATTTRDPDPKGGLDVEY